jgi:predicted Zn-dependent peptidase
MKHFLSCILASSILLGGTATLTQAPFIAQAASSTSDQVASLNVEHFVLPNGLNVYLNRNPAKPRFYAQVVINAGSKQDPADATGIAHYLEHMLFKGTDELGTQNFAKEKALLDKITALYEEHFQSKDEKKRKELLKQINKLTVEASQYAIPGELDSLYSRLGAQGLNAYTSNEETVYLVNMPSNRLEQWAKVESERFKDPVFRLFQSELETVYEEKNISMDDKDDILWEAVAAKLYKKHPYGQQTTLGTVDHLKNPSLKKMYAFYHQYYVPNNMALVISGDIDLAQTRKIIEKYFSVWKAQAVTPYKVPQESPLKGREQVDVNYKGEERVTLAFPTVPYGHRDYDALTMIDMLLDSGSFGLIKLNLVETQKVRAAGSSPWTNRDYGSEHLYAVPREGQTLAEAEKLLLDQLDLIKQGKFDEKHLQGVALDYEISLKSRLEDNAGRAALITDSFLKGLSLETLLSTPERLKKLTKDQISAVAQRYFGPNYVAGYRHDKEYSFPKIEKPELEKMKLSPNQRSPFVQAVEKLNPAPIQPRWVDFNKDFKISSFAPGVLFYTAANPTNDLFSFSVSYDYGDKIQPGFCTVMDELNFAGTGKTSARDVARKFFEMGVKANFSCGDYGFLMHLTGLDSQFEKALALGEEVLWNANLDQSRFEAKIENLLSNRADEKKDAKILRQALRNYIRYEAKSPFLDRPSAAELKKLNTNSYQAFSQALSKQNFKLFYTGQLPREQVEKIVHTYHQPKQINVPLLNPPQAPELALVKRDNKPVKIYFLNNPSVQSQIDLVIPGDLVDPQNMLMTSFYNEYMDGGMGAVMFQEVREARALAYSTWSYYLHGTRLGDQDQMIGYIGTQADKSVDALKLFITLLKNPPKSASHFERAMQALENRYRTEVIDYTKVLGSFQYWSDLGLDKDPRPEEFERLKQVSLESLFAYLQDKVATRPLTFTIVGDKTKIDMEALKKLGDFEEVPIQALFKD